MNYKNNGIHNSKGFTLVEMMVSISIVAIIMSVVLFSYRTFNDNLALSAAEQEISITLRQAQIFGLSVKEDAVGSGVFTTGFGVYFNTTDPTSYYLFADKYPSATPPAPNGNSKYDGDSSCSAGGECIEKYNIRDGVKIKRICGKVFGGSTTFNCPPTGATSMHITFVRPNPDALIYFTDNNNNLLGGNFQSGQVELVSPQGKTAIITVDSTGQISVQ